MTTKRITTYEINTVTWLYALSQRYKRSVTLSDIPPEEWDRIRRYGCDSVWLMGVWERSPAAAAITRADRGFMGYLANLFDDFDPDSDVIGSAYSVHDYVVSAELGGSDGLAKARTELKQRGMRLILDYVPNHVAPDHAWVTEHSEYFVRGIQEDIEAEPAAYFQADGTVIARGRDQEVDPWPDVLQLNAFSAELRAATTDVIKSIASHCDGIRCDSAMLLLNDVFRYTWQNRAGATPSTEYWSDVITALKASSPEFLFIAETYWHTEQRLFDLGFDYCYDKNTFYDAVEHDNTGELFHLLFQPIERQHRMVRFLENHDERRAADMFFFEKHKAAAIFLATTPGSRMYFEGQFNGLQIHTPMHIKRDPPQAVNMDIRNFYSNMFAHVNSTENGLADWQLCSVVTPEQRHIEQVMAWTWQGARSSRFLSVVNWSDQQQHVTVRLPWELNTSSSHLVCTLSTRDSENSSTHSGNRVDCELAPFEAVILEI